MQPFYLRDNSERAGVGRCRVLDKPLQQQLQSLPEHQFQLPLQDRRTPQVTEFQGITAQEAAAADSVLGWETAIHGHGAGGRRRGSAGGRTSVIRAEPEAWQEPVKAERSPQHQTAPPTLFRHNVCFFEPNFLILRVSVVR